MSATPSFVTLHYGIEAAPGGLPNRGADGFAKRLHYGGVERQRISSQCIKSHVRDADVIKRAAASIGTEMSVRSAQIAPKMLAPRLREMGIPEDAAETLASDVFRFLFNKEAAEKPSAEELPADDTEAEATGDAKPKKGKRAPLPVVDDPKATIRVLGKGEVEAIAVLAAQVHRNGLTFSKLPAPKSQPDWLKDALKALQTVGSGFDAALFGRMATSQVVSNVDGAVLVSPWVTTHPISATADYFSARDQLSESSGAAYVATQEVTSGVYYGSVVIDLRRLESNLGSNGKTPDIVAAVAEAFGTTDPSAKRGSTGASSRVVEIVAEVGPHAMPSAMGAFGSRYAYTGDEMARMLRDEISRRREEAAFESQRSGVVITMSETKAKFLDALRKAVA
jgi:CRISPR system Cascade subunit CasC